LHFQGIHLNFTQKRPKHALFITSASFFENIEWILCFFVRKLIEMNLFVLKVIEFLDFHDIFQESNRKSLEFNENQQIL